MNQDDPKSNPFTPPSEANDRVRPVPRVRLLAYRLWTGVVFGMFGSIAWMLIAAISIRWRVQLPTWLFFVFTAVAFTGGVAFGGPWVDKQRGASTAKRDDVG